MCVHFCWKAIASIRLGLVMGKKENFSTPPLVDLPSPLCFHSPHPTHRYGVDATKKVTGFAVRTALVAMFYVPFGKSQ
uniref:Putative secreted protein n=1 Tax=Anopheles triannulatus TaxID=58253 RepID=A0A2M4B4J2_9DIPT